MPMFDPKIMYKQVLSVAEYMANGGLDEEDEDWDDDDDLDRIQNKITQLEQIKLLTKQVQQYCDQTGETIEIDDPCHDYEEHGDTPNQLSVEEVLHHIEETLDDLKVDSMYSNDKT